MQAKRQNEFAPDRFEKSPIAWFGELVIADERGDDPRVAQA